MAKRERNKRAARKARQQERARVQQAQAAAGEAVVAQKGAQKQKAVRKQKTKVAVAKTERKGVQKVTGYFSDVRTEMRQVTWPSRIELRNYSVAVIVMLVVLGVVLWLIDTGFVLSLKGFTGLRG